MFDRFIRICVRCVSSTCNSIEAVGGGGGILYAASEERFTKKKNDSGYPSRAIEDAILSCGITGEKIEKIVLASQKVSPVQFLCDAGDYSIDDWLKEQKKYWKPWNIKHPALHRFTRMK